MNFDLVASSLTEDIYSRLKHAVSLGRWPDGRLLTKQQKTVCLEAILKYEIAHQIPETERTGYVENQCRSSTPQSTVIATSKTKQ